MVHTLYQSSYESTEDSFLLGCDAESSGNRIPTFRRNAVSSSSRVKMSYKNWPRQISQKNGIHSYTASQASKLTIHRVVWRIKHMVRQVKSRHCEVFLDVTYKRQIKIYVQYALQNPPLRSGRDVMSGCVWKICERGGPWRRRVQNSSYSLVSALCLHMLSFFYIHTYKLSVVPVQALETHAYVLESQGSGKMQTINTFTSVLLRQKWHPWIRIASHTDNRLIHKTRDRIPSIGIGPSHGLCYHNT
jgi:hypothetical protein